MNLFARILSHGFALALVALLAIGLVYRGDLFPGLELPEFLGFGSGGDSSEPADMPAETGVMSAADAPEVEPEPLETATAGAEETGNSTEVVVAEEPAAMEPEEAAAPMDAVPEPAAEPVQVPDAPAAMDTTMPAMTEPAGLAGLEDDDSAMAAAAETEELAAPPALETTGVAAPLETAASVEETAQAGLEQDDQTDGVSDYAAPQADDGGVEAQTGDGGDAAQAEAGAAQDMEQSPAEPGTGAQADHGTAYQLLAAAREAFWLRDYELAERKYRALIERDPVNPDGYGELGNMYFSQGDWEQAAAAYYEAGTRLVDQGLFDHAMQLVDVIKGLNGSQAGQLEEHIRAAMPAAE